MKRDRLTNFLLGLLAVLLAGIAAKVWEGVEIARSNQGAVVTIREDIRENRRGIKENRSDLDRLWGATSDLAEGVQ